MNEQPDDLACDVPDHVLDTDPRVEIFKLAGRIENHASKRETCWRLIAIDADELRRLCAVQAAAEA